MVMLESIPCAQLPWMQCANRHRGRNKLWLQSIIGWSAEVAFLSSASGASSSNEWLERGAHNQVELRCPALAQVERLVVVNHGSAAWACAGLRLCDSNGCAEAVTRAYA